MFKKPKAVPEVPETSPKERERLAIQVIDDKSFFDPKTYEFDDSFRPGNTSDFNSIHTIPELIEAIEKPGSTIEASGVFLEVSKSGAYRYKKLHTKKQILEAAKSNAKLKKMREARFREDFATDSVSSAGTNSGLVGDDFVPLLGGPFFKQQYLYDYLRSQSYCNYEYNHNPLARAVVHITRDFVLGRGYRIDSDDPKALALWRAFEKVNKLEELMEAVVKEGSKDGETMIWWLPNQEVSIGYKDAPGQEPQKGIIPRIRLLDPSTCWEIVTMPEDITRVLFYWFVFPTQYQIKTGTLAGSQVPTSKFITQQLPDEDVMHFKYNVNHNEKRGRSDLFPVLGYLKWVKDYINYKLIAMKKQAAWTEDISVEGSQADVDNLATALASLGEFEPAGSRFLHTNKITRTYLNTSNNAGGQDEGVMHGIDMIAAGTQIPVSYFGLSKSAGQTRASALVGTEPVAKKFERRQQEVRRILDCIWRKFQDKHGVYGSECTITFPEIISQDRSGKLKDIKMCEDSGYIARETAAQLAAKELDVDNYDYQKELEKIQSEQSPPIMPTLISPLTSPAASPAPQSPQQAPQDSRSSSAITQDERVNLKQQGTNL